MYTVSKKYVVSLIHNHYDANEDDLLTAREIYDAVSLDKVKALSDKCTFFDILRIWDQNGDKMLNAEEMYSAFGEYNARSLNTEGFDVQNIIQTRQDIKCH